MEYHPWPTSTVQWISRQNWGHKSPEKTKKTSIAEFAGIKLLVTTLMPFLVNHVKHFSDGMHQKVW